MHAQIQATLRLALPMILGQGAQLLMHVLDSVMVGRLGIRELAAGAMGNAAAALFFFVGIALGSTVPALAARAFGAGDRGRMNLVLRHGLVVSLVYGVTCAALFAVASPWLLRLFGPAELVGEARAYSILLMTSLIPALLVQNFRGFAEAQRHPWLPLGNIALGVGLNFGFNYLLIYGNFGLPALGLPGAALGTLLARCLMLGHFVWVLRRRPEIAPASGFWRPVRGAERFYGEYLRLAVPMAGILVVLSGNTVVIQFLMGRIGLTALAAGEIGRQLWLLLFSVPLGFSFAVAIRTGHAAGAGDGAEVRRIAWSSLAAAVAGMCLLTLALLAGRDFVARQFLDPGAAAAPAVLALAAQVLVAVGVAVLADTVTVTCLGVFRGLAALRVPALCYASGVWLLGLPLAYGFGFAGGFGAAGVWFGVMTGALVTAGVFFFLLRRTLRRLPGA